MLRCNKPRISTASGRRSTQEGDDEAEEEEEEGWDCSKGDLAGALWMRSESRERTASKPSAPKSERERHQRR